MRRRSQEVLQVLARTTGLAFPPVICVQQLSVTLSHEFGSLSPHSAFSVLRVVLFTLVPTLFACRGLWFNSQPMNEVENELSTISPDLLRLAQQRNSTALLLDELPRRFLPQVIAEVGPPQRTWELTGLVHLHAGRPHETLGIFSALYQRMLVSQLLGDHRVHKGMPLVWMSDCFHQLGYPVHEKRYRLLTLCEDAIRGQGTIPSDSTGAYHRLVWAGLSDREFRRYAALFWERAQAEPKEAVFPEALLQRVDDDWVTAVPSAAEAFFYLASEEYVRWLLSQLGSPDGTALEFLADYLMSCMPGCRTRRRARSGSTDYDVVCSMEGSEVDFRSELGRYFVVESKDWAEPAGFTTMAKFCRVLDSSKAKFGILLSKNGISGVARTTDAAREQLKVYQDRGIVVVVLSLEDLGSIAEGASLIALLRKRYEAVRLDLQEIRTKKPAKQRKQK